MWTQIRLLQSDLSLHCLFERLLKHFSRRQKQSNFVVIGALRVNRAKQLNRRRQMRPAFIRFSMAGKRSQKKLKSYLFTDTLVYTIAHWPGPPRTYMNFIQDQQGRLVYVRTAVAATCINILSQVAQRNEDLIACSVL